MGVQKHIGYIVHRKAKKIPKNTKNIIKNAQNNIFLVKFGHIIVIR